MMTATTSKRKLGMAGPPIGGSLMLVPARAREQESCTNNRDDEASTEVASPDALMNAILRAYATRSTWVHADLLVWLHTWYALLNDEFFCEPLPVAAISVERLHRRTLGTYRIGRDGLALTNRITLNESYVAASPARCVATLLHEMLHAWEERMGGTTGRYHSARFRERAAALGIPTDRSGHDLGITPDGRLARLLELHGVALSDKDILHATADGALPDVTPRSRLSKWDCGCTVVRVSSGVEMMGECLKCRNRWQRAEAGARHEVARG